MLDRSRLACFKLLAVGLYALASLAIGFADVSVIPSFVADSQAALMAVFTLPDEAPLQFCGGGAGAFANRQGEKTCDACPLTAAPGALPAKPCVPPPPRAITRLTPFYVTTSVAPPPLHAPHSRGPPSSLTAFV